MSKKLLDIIPDISARDKMLLYMQGRRHGSLELTNDEQLYSERLEFCDNIIRAHPGARNTELADMVAGKYDISHSHAKKLLQDAKYVYGSASKPVRQYERMRINEILWKIIDKAQATNPEVCLKAVEIYNKVNKLDDFTLDTEGEEETGAKTIIVRPVFAPEQLGVELPENVEDIVKQLRERTRVHQKAINQA